jgi:hypothetical protein
MTMPQPPKYTREQRKAVYELFMTDREGRTGKFTLKDIERLTGVPAGTAWMIARGKR